jgi:hypothetical protein
MENFQRSEDLRGFSVKAPQVNLLNLNETAGFAGFCGAFSSGLEKMSRVKNIYPT